MNQNSKIFINAAFVIVRDFDSSATFDSGRTIELKSKAYFAFGLCYEFHERLTTEVRFQTTRDIATDYQITE